MEYREISELRSKSRFIGKEVFCIGWQMKAWRHHYIV